jgi:hypothetical protein
MEVWRIYEEKEEEGGGGGTSFVNIIYMKAMPRKS